MMKSLMLSMKLSFSEDFDSFLVCEAVTSDILFAVPTLFEAAVEHIGELFHENHTNVYRLPIPEVVKVNLSCFGFCVKRNIWEELCVFIFTVGYFY